MTPRLKPLAEQVIVITGASSGHGLATAEKAAAAGAKVLLVARDDDALADCRDRIRAAGGIAEAYAADVALDDASAAIAAFTVATFGGFDTWVNNAGTGVYAKAEDIASADHRQVFEVNYWGVVNGTLAALEHLKDRPGGGAIINVGSINSDMPSPILSSYTASKHAVKGFTDSLRLEVIADDLPVSVTLVKPAAIGTPFPEHGRNFSGRMSRLPPPLYAPDLVADVILRAAVHPRRSVVVGGFGKLQVLGATMLPWLFDRVASRMGPTLLDRSKPAPPEPGNLYETLGTGGRVEGRQTGRRISLFALLGAYPLATAGALAMGAGGACLFLLRNRDR